MGTSCAFDAQQVRLRANCDHPSVALLDDEVEKGRVGATRGSFVCTPLSVVSPAGMRRRNIALLPGLGAASEQHDRVPCYASSFVIRLASRLSRHFPSGSLHRMVSV